MKKILLLLIIWWLTCLLVGCKKESEKNSIQYGCIYGQLKTTSPREFIACWPKEIYLAGTNQAAADAAAQKLGIQRINVAGMANYINREFVPNNNCNCN
jgi:hypothetical protein